MILIILILIIIIFTLNYKNHNENFDVRLLDKLQDCSNDNTNNNNIFKNIYTQSITIDQKELNKYLLDIAYPVGSFYVQFPDISHNQVSRAFPEDTSPQKLFGGVWEVMWDKDAVFFRTEGSLANNSRSTKGIQPDAIRNLNGNTAWTQTNYWNSGGNSSGVFTAKLQKIGTDKGGGTDTGSRNLFELSAVIQIGNELRVRNRIFRIWKRIS